MYRPLLLATLALLCLPLAAEPRLATLEYPPYSSQTQAAGGSIVELTRSAVATQGYTPSIDFMPWARVRAELRSGRYQGPWRCGPRKSGKSGCTPHARCSTASSGSSCGATRPCTSPT